MKKNICNKLIILAIIFFFISFNFVNANNDVRYSYKDILEKKIGLDYAKKITVMKLKELEKYNDFVINNIEIIFNDDYSKTLFFIIELVPKGFMIISADYNLPPVIAYSFNSNIDKKNDLFIELIKEDINLRLENIQNIPDNIIHERNSMWDYFIYAKNEISLKKFEQWPPEGTTPTEGWILSTWTQSSPYNDFCPIDPDSGIRCVAGCPAVTMSQILNYHETTNNVFFDDNDDYFHNYIYFYTIDDDCEEYDFPSFPDLNGYLSALNNHYTQNIEITNEDKAALNFACGVAAKQVYTPEVSGTFGVDQAYDAYLKFNCNNIELIKTDNEYLYERIIQNIKDAYPVHLAVVTPAWDSGHNLIIDGYNTDNFYHLNFGWGGYLDAWYLLPDEIPYGLTVIEGVIVDILYDQNRSDLNCNGRLNWIDVSPGSTLYGNFTVENVGISGSLLNWSIESTPDWGNWEINPKSGINLSPENGSVNVEVKVIAPERKSKEFIGGIKIINDNFPGDSDYIQVSLTTPKIDEYFDIDLINFIQSHIILFRFIY